MENTVLDQLAILREQGFTDHVYGNPLDGYFYKGAAFDYVQRHSCFIIDETDRRVFLDAVTSACGYIKGVAIYE